nr:response regulator [Xenococcus sp. MO_188.B8]
LIVDDKEENHLALNNILKPLGFEIVSVENGQLALEIAPFIQPDLILLDLYMPVKTGFTLMGELRKMPKFETTPIILISACSYEVLQKASQHFGCEAFLTKPVDENKLLDLLEEYGMLPKHVTS